MSESPEEQPSTGVLGRIGSWFSPWRGKGTKSPTENAFPTSDRALKLEGEEESEECARTPARELQWEEEDREQGCDHNPLGLSRDVFLCEREDATQSARRESSVVSSPETAGGGPKEVEFVECSKKRIGQGEESEESSIGTSASWNPKRNASHLTHLSSSPEQGVVWETAHVQPQAQRRAQARAGRRLHVYLEETSVIQSDQDTRAGQEVVRTKVTKSLQVLPKAKSSPSLDSPKSSTSAENKRTNVRPAAGTQSYYSALVGVSLKSCKDSQPEPEPDREQAEADSMGRKNAARRRLRKNSQGDGGNSPQDKMFPNAQPVPEGIPTSDNSVTSPQGQSPQGESSVNSSSKHSPTSQASPEGGESKTSCLDTIKQLDDFQDSNSVIAASLVFDGGADMEDNDSFYTVERKTETPESKRRSIKVSRSEVKLFTKNVPLNPKQSSAGGSQHFWSALQTTEDEAKDKVQAETDARLHDQKKIDEEPKSVAGGIADKISLFEPPAAGVRTPRSVDVSPTRKATQRQEENVELSDQRSRSAERCGAPRSSSASPVREGKPMTVKERARNFTQGRKPEDKPALPPKPATAGMSQRSTSSVTVIASKPPELDNQGKQDTKKQRRTKVPPQITLKPDGQDTTAAWGKTSAPKELQTVSKTKDAVASETEGQGTKPDSVKTGDPAKGPGDSAELTNNLSPQSKCPSRTASRTKRRKSREQMSPLSPDSENKPDCSTSRPEVTAVKQEPVGDAEETASKQPTETFALTDKGRGNRSEKQPRSDTAHKDFKREAKVLEKQTKQFVSSTKNENIDRTVNRQEEFPEPSVKKDEPDIAAGTKTPIDKDPVVLSEEEGKAGGHSLLFTQERERASKNGRETPSPSPSPASERPIDKTPWMPELVKKLPRQSAPNTKGKVREPKRKDAGQQPQSEAAEQIRQKLEKVESGETNRPEKKDKEKTQHVPPLDKNTTKTKISGTEGHVARDDEIKSAEKKEETRLVEDTTKPETNKPEPSSESASSDPPVQPQHAEQTTTTTTHPQRAAVCALVQTNEDLSGTKSDEGPAKGVTATNVPPELQSDATKSPGTETESAVIAAEPRPNSVEKMENSADDSSAHGANDAESSSPKPITKAVTAAVEVTVKAGNDTPALITAQADNMPQRESSVKEPTPSPFSKSASSEGARQADREKNAAFQPQVAPEVKISRDIMKLTPGLPRREESKDAKITSEATSLEGAEKKAQRPSDFPVSVVKKTAEKTLHSPMNELPPVANGDVSVHPQLRPVKKEPVGGEPSQTPEAPPSPEAKKLIPDSTQRSSLKKLHVPQGLSKDDSATHQDAPSSWLDVDFPKRKLKVPAPKLSSAGSESNLLDTSLELDDDDFIEKINKLCAPFSLPPRKHNPLRPPQPPFALPAIKEARFEKTFDPEEFKFGLRKNKQFTIDSAPSLLAKLQNTETKSALKPARASLADRSLLLSSLDSQCRLREKTPVKADQDVVEEKEDQLKVKSRLEGSCVLSRLSSSSLRGKRNGVQAQAEGTTSGDTSPSEAPQLSPPPSSQQPPPSPTAPAPLKVTSAAPSSGGEAQAAGAVVTDSCPPFPSFNNIKLPDYLEKYLPREPAKPAQAPATTEVIGKVTAPAVGDEADRLAVKPAPLLPDAVPPCFPGSPPTTHPALPEPKQPAAQPQATLSNKIRVAKGFHKRPGKMVLFEEAEFGGRAYEIYRDVADATSLQLSPLISVKVIRGCWVLYEKPDFQGRSIALEEGGTELANIWAEPGLETDSPSNQPMLIGSIRLAVWDYSLPHIDLFTEPEGHGRVTPYHDDTIETGSFGLPLSTASIQVHSGVWLVFSDPGFQGMLAVLETGVYPFPETWGFPSPFVGSLRPLKMGGFKVENPSEVKAVVYEEPGFEGSCLEIDGEVFNFCESEGDDATDGGNPDSKKLKSGGSLKIIGGLWVGYNQPGFEGQQHILEEGEYLDCSDWGGSEHLLSLRPMLGDFVSPHLKMFSDRDFGELGVNIDLTVPVINMDDTGYGLRTQSIDVMGGVWVVFEEPGFCGESYILEKGLYGRPEDWGALQPRVASAMPVVLDDFENAAKFKVQLFSEPGFQGTVLTLEDSVASLQGGFSVASCKVLAGSWLGFEGQDFAGRMYVLEVGSYPDPRAMGCVHASASILSLQTVGFEFSLPSITLFERRGLRGRRVVLTGGSVNLQLAGGCSTVQSVLVEGGMWVLYEEINYRGTQLLLKPGEVHDWRMFSSWRKIGSLRPLIQKQAHFRLRNRQTGLMMAVTGDLDDIKLLRIQETEETDGLEQIWSYQNGHLHCKLLEECCLCPSGSMTMAGSRVGLTPEIDTRVHLWSITSEGFICYTPTSDLVLEVKGGHHYDKNQVVLKSLDPNKLHQRWDVEII